MNRKRKSFDRNAEMDDQLDEYEPSDSDDDYDDNEKLLLDRARKGKSLNEDDDGDPEDDEDDNSEEEVLGIYSSDDEENKKGGDEVENMDSDIEGIGDNDRLPDPKAWGKRKKDYYHTDYVDQDFGGFAREEEEEIALMEEKEARTLQSRLAAQLDDVDFSSSVGLISMDDKKKADKLEIKDWKGDDTGLYDDIVKTDLSKLTKREKMALFQKESPEFFGLVSDYKERLMFAKEKLFPVMNLIKSGHLSSSSPCAKFIELKTHVTLNYCTNLAFYLLLKKKRIGVKDHPVISRLLKYRNLLQKMDKMETEKYIEQLNEINDCIKVKGGADILFSDYCDVKQKRHKNKKLKLLLSASQNNNDDDDYIAEKNIAKKKKEMTNKSQLLLEDNTGVDDFDVLPSESDLEDNDDDSIDIKQPNKRLKLIDKVEVDEDGKRPITYEIAKNKGLTPYRKKEQRNPRVKHRNKYRKALIRIKGQVRQVQSKVPKYGGEIFGIRASVIKSKKFK